MANLTNELLELARLSQQVGANPAYVQGGGGNISVKLSTEQMAIKASGWCLSDITATSGICVVDYAAICQYLKNADVDDTAFSQAINAFVIDSTSRPSIETGFHALLEKYVIHSHSVYANLLNCAKEGQALLKKLFPQAAWVSYETPGRDLTLAIKTIVARTKDIPSLLFLENHGLIVNAATAENVLALHETVNETIKNHFMLDIDAFKNHAIKYDKSFMKKHVLFPDQVVYTLGDEALLKTTAAQETFAAYDFILHTLNEKKLTPMFIEEKKAQYLLNMETEKYRQQVIKNDLYSSPC